MANKEMYTFTAEQQMLLARYVLPEDINKHVVQMASFIFRKEEMTNITAANLDKSKIAFMSSKLLYDTIMHSF